MILLTKGVDKNDLIVFHHTKSQKSTINCYLLDNSAYIMRMINQLYYLKFKLLHFFNLFINCYTLNSLRFIKYTIYEFIPN